MVGRREEEGEGKGGKEQTKHREMERSDRGEGGGGRIGTQEKEKEREEEMEEIERGGFR